MDNNFNNTNNNKDNDNNANTNPGAYEYRPQGTTPPNPPQYNQTGYTNRTPVEPPKQQTQWSFNDYGPLGNGPKPPVNNPVVAKPKEKIRTSLGIKVFAVVISALFVLSTVSFGVYAAYDYNQDLARNNAQQNEPITPPTTGDNGMNLSNTPDNSDTPSADGRLSTQQVFKTVNDSVVGIVTYVAANGYQTYGQGSGVIMTNDGYVVTNAHVVTGDMQIAKIDVVLSNGDTFEAKLIGSDVKTDLAVLKIDAPNLKPAEFGDSDKLEVGEDVIVIGNPDGIKFANSLTTGVVSALNREVTTEITGRPVKYIQTTAAINPGNSGGALINHYGQIVGIPVAKIVKTGFEGMCFAIPINDVKPVVDSIIQNGYVRGRVKIGITYSAIPESHAFLNGIPIGLRVVSVDPDFSAAQQGVTPGDIITHMDGQTVSSTADLDKILPDKKPGDTLELTIYRVNESGTADTIKINVTLGEMGPEAN